MFRVLLCVAFVLFSGCSQGCGGASIYEDQRARVAVEAGVVIYSVCWDGQVLGQGSGTAIGPMHVLTAGHNVSASREAAAALCGGPDMFTFQIVYQGQRYAADVYDVQEELDAAILQVPGDETAFPVYAKLARRARIGEQVCVYSMGGANDHTSYKCGWVSSYGDMIILGGIQGAPGNSGAGMINAEGELVGILTSGFFRDGQEIVVMGASVSALRPVIPSEIFYWTQ